MASKPQYLKGAVYLQSNSRAARLLETLRLESTDVGHALTMAEWRAAHVRRAGEEPKNMDSAVWRLRHRGFVLAVGGRTRSVQYCAADAPQPPQAVADPYDLLESVVVSQCRATGEAADLVAITDALTAAGCKKTTQQVSVMLSILTTASPNRALAHQQQERLECLTVIGDHWNRTRRFWRPVGTEFPAPTSKLESYSAAVRALLAAAGSEIGRPVSLVELKAFADANPEHPAVVALRSREGKHFARLFNNVRLNGEGATILDVSHSLATHGGIPNRYCVPSPDGIGLAAARYQDCCYWLRPEAEVAATRFLREAAEMYRAPTLLGFADLREAALQHALWTDLGAAGLDEVGTGDLEAHLSGVRDTLYRWGGDRPRNTSGRPTRWLTEVDAAIAALPLFAESHRGATAAAADLTLAGGAGLRSIDEVREWLVEVLQPEGRSFTTMSPHIFNVRHFPNPNRTRGPLRGEAYTDHSMLDVGDVLARVAELTSSARLAVLLQSATCMLGSVVRDPRPLRAVLHGLPLDATPYRFGTMVALGALGQTPDVALVQDADDPAFIEAYALSLVLAESTADARARLCHAAESHVVPSLRGWTREIAGRLAEGSTFGSIL